MSDEELATALFAVTTDHYGGLMVPFHSQPAKIREYHLALAREARKQIITDPKRL